MFYQKAIAARASAQTSQAMLIKAQQSEENCKRWQKLENLHVIQEQQLKTVIQISISKRQLEVGSKPIML
jgi:hypothetical protein